METHLREAQLTLDCGAAVRHRQRVHPQRLPVLPRDLNKTPATQKTRQGRGRMDRAVVVSNGVFVARTERVASSHIMMPSEYASAF